MGRAAPACPGTLRLTCRPACCPPSLLCPAAGPSRCSTRPSPPPPSAASLRCGGRTAFTAVARQRSYRGLLPARWHLLPSVFLCAALCALHIQSVSGWSCPSPADSRHPPLPPGVQKGAPQVRPAPSRPTPDCSSRLLAGTAHPADLCCSGHCTIIPWYRPYVLPCSQEQYREKMAGEIGLCIGVQVRTGVLTPPVAERRSMAAATSPAAALLGPTPLPSHAAAWLCRPCTADDCPLPPCTALYRPAGGAGPGCPGARRARAQRHGRVLWPQAGRLPLHRAGLGAELRLALRAATHRHGRHLAFRGGWGGELRWRCRGLRWHADLACGAPAIASPGLTRMPQCGGAAPGGVPSGCLSLPAHACATWHCLSPASPKLSPLPSALPAPRSP